MAVVATEVAVVLVVHAQQFPTEENHPKAL
jgi:hypothetical protein